MTTQLYCCDLIRILQSLQIRYLAAVKCLTFYNKCLCRKDAWSRFWVPISQTEKMKQGSRKDFSNARLGISSCPCSLPTAILSSRLTITCWQIEANGKGVKTEGCRKGGGPNDRLGLKLAAGLTGACFGSRAAIHFHWSHEVFGIKHHKNIAAELQLSQLFCTCLVCPCPVITIWSPARRSDSFSSTETVCGALRGHSPFLPHWGREIEGDKCWTNPWALARVRDGTVVSQLRKHCLFVSAVLADPTVFLFLLLCSSSWIFLLDYKAVC